MKLRKRLMRRYLLSYLADQYRHVNTNLHNISDISLIIHAQYCGLWR